jgi:hypothetical protein
MKRKAMSEGAFQEVLFPRQNSLNSECARAVGIIGAINRASSQVDCRALIAMPLPDLVAATITGWVTRQPAARTLCLDAFFVALWFLSAVMFSESRASVVGVLN